MSTRKLCFGLLAASITSLWAQHADPTRVAAGKKLYESSCAACHGQNAQGGRGPDLTKELRHGRQETEIIHNIVEGIPGTQMPAFRMPEEDARSIVVYLVSLRTTEPDIAITGDAAAGRKRFFSDGGCSRCHMYNGVGGRLGPDLSAVGESRKGRELQELLGQRHKRLVPGFETIEVRLKDGRHLRGIRKNEDTFSLQMMAVDEKLHMLMKKDLVEVRSLEESLMPVGIASGKQADDLIAFLKKGSPGEPEARAWTPAADLNVSFDRLKASHQEPHNWLTYWGDYRGNHYSSLDSISTGNIDRLNSAWTYQFGGTLIETTPIVVDGLMFVTGPRNAVTALDARTGRSIWRYTHKLPGDHRADCTVMTNRGVAVLGDRLYMATLDTRLIALDAKTGNEIWNVPVEDYKTGMAITHAPLAINGKIIVGITAGECALAGFLDAYDAATGKRIWRMHTTPRKGDPARATWAGDSADVGGTPTWMTGTYDPETDTLFWPTGNPAPDYDGSVRAGDNLYSCSVLALEPGTGKMKWYFQFTPHDTHDWDATETPVLVDTMFKGKMRKLLLHADRNAFFYVLDRSTGEFLLGKPFAKQTWAKGLDDRGRPVVLPGTDPTPQGVSVCPDATGATNWAAPSWSPQTKLFYVVARDACGFYTSTTKEPKPGEPYVGSGVKESTEPSPGAVRAIDPQTGDIRWSFALREGFYPAGVLSTAGNLVFAGTKEGHLIALDAQTGKELWHYQTGAPILSSPISYRVDGRQYIAVSTDSALFTFAVRESTPDRTAARPRP